MHSYAAVFRNFWTLEDTLVGYMFNDLIWCGQEEDSGRRLCFCVCVCCIVFFILFCFNKREIITDCVIELFSREK